MPVRMSDRMSEQMPDRISEWMTEYCQMERQEKKQKQSVLPWCSQSSEPFDHGLARIGMNVCCHWLMLFLLVHLHGYQICSMELLNCDTPDVPVWIPFSTFCVFWEPPGTLWPTKDMDMLRIQITPTPMVSGHLHNILSWEVAILSIFHFFWTHPSAILGFPHTHTHTYTHTRTPSITLCWFDKTFEDGHRVRWWTFEDTMIYV